MCGYFGNLHESPVVIDLLNQIGIPLPYPQRQSYPRRLINGLITSEIDETGNRTYHSNVAFWWYQLAWKENKPIASEQIKSFNARDLSKPLWKEASKHRRGCVIATELGDSNGKQRFLMKAKTPFALGTLYKDWINPYSGEVIRSFAIITRPPHARYSRYHDKSFPLFLPLEESLIEDWLDPRIQSNPAIEEILNAPTLTHDLEVTPVRTYKHGEALGEPTQLLKDD